MNDPLPQAKIAVDVKRIALCHLESLTCVPALNRVFEVFGDRIGLVLVSGRFDSVHGGVLGQFFASVRKSGVRMTIWLGFDIISAQVVTYISRILRILGSPSLETLPALARRHGAMIEKTGNINSQETLALLGAYAPDVLLLINFDQILQSVAIGVPRLGVLNIHPALLPAFRGPCPVFWAVAEGRAATGVTVHRVEDASIDTGGIVRQAERTIDAGSSVAEINTDLFLAGASILHDAIEDLSSRRAIASPATAKYWGFPTRQQVADARARGLRLCRFKFAIRLMAAMVLPSYWCKWPSA